MLTEFRSRLIYYLQHSLHCLRALSKHSITTRYTIYPVLSNIHISALHTQLGLANGFEQPSTCIPGAHRCDQQQQCRRQLRQRRYAARISGLPHHSQGKLRWPTERKHIHQRWAEWTAANPADKHVQSFRDARLQRVYCVRDARQFGRLVA